MSEADSHESKTNVQPRPLRTGGATERTRGSIGYSAALAIAHGASKLSNSAQTGTSSKRQLRTRILSHSKRGKSQHPVLRKRPNRV